MSVLTHIADRVINRPLMILPDKLALIAQVLEGRLGIDAAELRPEADTEAARRYSPDASRYVGNFEPVDPNNPEAGRKPYRTTREGVAVIPVLGSLVNRGSWLDAMSGITSYERFKFQVGAAADDTTVRSIVLDMDSPGGEAIGAFEAADVVRDAAARKPVVAVVNGMAASAAYAIASAATRIVTTSSGVSGSIGVVMLHVDHSHRLHEAGVVPTLIYAGARKVDGNPYKPLTDDVRAELKGEVERFYDLFVASVARGRSGMSVEAIRGTEARVFLGADAVAAGLADEVGSFEAVIASLSARGGSRRIPSSTKGTRMDNPQGAPAANAGISQAEHDTAVANARTAGVAEGRTLGAQAERDRVAAILALDESKDRREAALAIAMTGATVEQAKAVLAASPIAPATSSASLAAERAANQPLSIVPEAPKDAKAAWGNLVKSYNERH